MSDLGCASDEISYAVPTFWTEVYNRSIQEWVTVDVVRNKLRPRKGEMDNGRLFYVVAYEVDQYIKDITPRYVKSYAGRTLKMRIQNRRKDDPDWFDEAIQPWTRPFSLGRELKEDAELARYQEAEPMPTVVEGFKNHPRYVLERHLKREEVLLPKTKQLGLFRGEPVYPRSAVVGVKSSENWMREGRTIRDGEQPLKTVKQRAVTVNRRRAQEMAMQDGQEPLMQGLYARNQTELVIPPPIVNGKIPKNSYGNIDLFAPHMLPKGAVHLPHKNIRKVARDLGIDHSEAITGFEFHKRRAVPTVSGIVVAEENKDMLLEAYYAQETLAVEKEMAKRKERALKKWKKLIVGLRVRSRIQGEYRKAEGASDQGKEKAKAGPEPEGKSQFQLAGAEEAEKSQLATVPDLSATSGGFIAEGLHPEIPGGAAFLPQHPHPPPPLDDGPQLDLTMLDLPPMPVPDPAAVDYQSPPADLTQQAFNADFDYPPQTELDDMAIDASHVQVEALQEDSQEDDRSSRSSSSVTHHSDHVDLDEFTLRDPEDIAKGAPEIEEEEADASMQGGFLRDEEDEVVKAPDATVASRKKHRQPSQNEETGTDQAAIDSGLRKETNGHKLRKSRSLHANGRHESDGDEEEYGDDDNAEEEEEYRQSPSPPKGRTSRSTRASTGSKKVNGADNTSPSSTRQTRRSTRTSTAHTNGDAQTAPKRTTRASLRATKKADTTEEEADDDENTTEDEVIQVTSRRSTRGSERNKSQTSNGRSTRASRRAAAAGDAE